MSKIQFGVLSTAKIALEKVIPALKHSYHCEVAAIASRSAERAEKVAGKSGIEISYGSYDKLLNDSRVEAIYIPLPNNMHLRWTKKALKAGKHVLVEKPVTCTVEEAEELIRFKKDYPQLLVMEAFMYRFHPQWTRVKELIQNGEIGKLQLIDCQFSYYKTDPGNIRNQPEKGGGAMLDIGCYCINAARFLFENEPHTIKSCIEYDKELGIDHLSSGLLEFEEGQARFSCATQLFGDQRVTIYGTNGKITLKQPFNNDVDKPVYIHLLSDNADQCIKIDACDHYKKQVDTFAEAIISGNQSPILLEDSAANMRVIGAVFENSENESK